MHSPQDYFIITLSLTTDVTDMTLGASGFWLGTRTGAGGTATLTKSFFWPQSMDSRIQLRWFGHIMRRYDITLNKEVFNSKKKTRKS